MSEFPGRNWKLSSLSRLIKKIDETGSLDRKVGSGRPRSVQTADSIACIDHAIGQFRKRLASIIAAKSGHVEHSFD